MVFLELRRDSRVPTGNSGCKYRTPERIEYQLQLANKVALQGIMPEKYRMSSVMGRIE